MIYKKALAILAIKVFLLVLGCSASGDMADILLGELQASSDINTSTSKEYSEIYAPRHTDSTSNSSAQFPELMGVLLEDQTDNESTPAINLSKSHCVLSEKPSDSFPSANNQINTIRFTLPYHPNIESWPDSFRNSFYCINVTMNDIVMESKINEVLTNAQIGWISESVASNGGSGGHTELESIDITLYGDRFLSLYTRIHLVDNRYWLIQNGATVDLATGMRVFLNDIVDTSDAFLAFLKTGEPLLTYSVAGEYGEITDNNRSEIFNYDDDFLRKVVMACSSAMSGDIAELLVAATFYLENGRFTIAFNQTAMGSPMKFTFDAKMCQPFLKVDIW